MTPTERDLMDALLESHRLAECHANRRYGDELDRGWANPIFHAAWEHAKELKEGKR